MREMKIKTRLKWQALLSVMVIITAQGFSAAAPQPSDPKTVADFFLLAPERYVGYDLAFREGLVRGERRGTVIDVPNGYIYWNASDNPEEFEFALFKKRNGKYIVAFSAPYDSQFPNSGRFVLLSYDRGKWRNVTKALLPVKYDKTLTYKLPRQGRTIEVAGEWGRKHYQLTWVNDRFTVSRPRSKKPGAKTK
jgi:hypothetical protein